MVVHLLTWNPDKADGPHEPYEEFQQDLAGVEPIQGQWSVGNHKYKIHAGDTAYFLKQGSGDRGIFGRVRILTSPYEGPHWSIPEKTTNYVEYEWIDALDEYELIPISVLQTLIPGVKWNYIQQSGHTVSDSVADEIAPLWESALNVGLQPDGLGEGEVVFAEGGRAISMVNRYERDPNVRAACLAHWGYACSACGVNLGDVYGEIGQDFIHVHHLKPLGEIKEVHVVDPVADLRPVCPNCHSMVHRVSPPMPIEALRKLVLAKRKSKA